MPVFQTECAVEVALSENRRCGRVRLQPCRGKPTAVEARLSSNSAQQGR